MGYTLRPLLILLTIVSSLLCNAQINLSQGLIAHWNFNGDAKDASVYGNHGIVSDAILAPGKSGLANTAYRFNGVSSFIEVDTAASLNINMIFSIFTQIKVHDFYRGYCHGNTIVGKGNTIYTPGNYTLIFSDAPYSNGTNCIQNSNPDEEHQNFYIQRASTTSPIPPDTPFIKKDLWYSVCATTDGIITKIYVDGNLVSTYPSNGGGVNNDKLYIGMTNNGLHRYWLNATVDNIRIYNRVLNTNEIDSLHSYVDTAPLAVDNYYSALDVALYPNPSNDVAILNLMNLSGDGQLVVSTMDGQTVLSQTIYKKTREKIDVSNFANGLYLFTIKTDGQQKVIKFLKNN